jgi:hypothetical protein
MMAWMDKRKRAAVQNLNIDDINSFTSSPTIFDF